MRTIWLSTAMMLAGSLASVKGLTEAELAVHNATLAAQAAAVSAHHNEAVVYYRSKGVSDAQAREMATRLVSQPSGFAALNSLGLGNTGEFFEAWYEFFISGAEFTAESFETVLRQAKNARATGLVGSSSAESASRAPSDNACSQRTIAEGIQLEIVTIERELQTVRAHFPSESDTLKQAIQAVASATTPEEALSKIQKTIDTHLTTRQGTPRTLERYIPAVTESRKLCKGHKDSRTLRYHSNAEQLGNNLRRALPTWPSVDSASVRVWVPNKVPVIVNILSFPLLGGTAVHKDYTVEWLYHHHTLRSDLSPCSECTVTTVELQSSRTERSSLSMVLTSFNAMKQTIESLILQRDAAAREVEQMRQEVEAEATAARQAAEAATRRRVALGAFMGGATDSSSYETQADQEATSSTLLRSSRF